MQIAIKLERKILVLYAATMVFIALFIVVTLYQSWQRHYRETSEELVQDANLAAIVLDATLGDGSRLLDVARVRLEEAREHGELSEGDAFRTLTASIATFSISGATNFFGLLFYVDRHGRLFARSGEYPCRKINFNDRLYYTELRDHPEKRFTVGNLLRARTTGKSVFHMSAPLFDDKGEFDGIVVQQIVASDMAEKMRDVLLGHTSYENTRIILAHTDKGKVAFVYPLPRNLSEIDEQYAAQVQAAAGAGRQRLGWIEARIPLHGGERTVMAGYARTPVFGLLVSASVGKNEVVREFWRQNRDILIYALLGVALTSIMFLSLYRRTRALTVARGASLHDPLTGLYNRRAFDEEYDRIRRISMRQQSAVSILFIDIDHFKRFNDKYGHEVGDMVLQRVAREISACLRRPLDFCCRWGGGRVCCHLAGSGTGKCRDAFPRDSGGCASHRIA